MILKYTKILSDTINRHEKSIQFHTKLRAKSEPWLHIAIYSDTAGIRVIYAIYVWDTRQIIESGTLPMSMVDINNIAKQVGEKPTDNHEKLHGGIDWINKEISIRMNQK
jgi:hypothetical protein